MLFTFLKNCLKKEGKEYVTHKTYLLRGPLQKKSSNSCFKIKENFIGKKQRLQLTGQQRERAFQSEETG